MDIDLKLDKQNSVEPFLVAEQPALDLLNSVCSPWGEEIEWISDGRGLVSWLQKAELISACEAQHIQNTFSNHGLDRVSDKVCELRETFRIFIHRYASHEITIEALESLEFINQILKKNSYYSAISYDDVEQKLRLQNHRHLREPEDILQVIAQSMAECVCESNWSRIRKCQNEICTLWFLDTSKNGRRIWCSMAVCGNRAKAAAHRKRQKT